MLSSRVPSFFCSPATVVYTPRGVFPHAVSLDQTFVHCPRFPVAATRRCRPRVSVTLWGAMLSHPLPVIALVSHYLTNKLIGRRLLLKRLAALIFADHMRYYPAFRLAIPHFKVDSYALLTRPPLVSVQQAGPVTVRLACLRHTASVHPEPGSNSQKREFNKFKISRKNGYY